MALLSSPTNFAETALSGSSNLVSTSALASADRLKSLSVLRAEGGIDVDMDLTVFGQVALFVVLMLALKPLLFDPMLKLFEEREKRIEGARAESIALDKASADAQGKYDDEMQKARGLANAERDQLRAEGAKTENEILGSARDKTAAKLDQGRASLATEVVTAKTNLKLEAQHLAAEVASRVLGREVRS